MNVNSTGKITRLTAKEIWEAEDTTDLERVRSMTDEDIKDAIADDPDTFETDEDFWEDAVSCPPLLGEIIEARSNQKRRNNVRNSNR